MKSLLYILIASLIAFGTGMFLLRQTLDTKIYTNETCRHPEQTTAYLYWKSTAYYCYWYVGDDTEITANWDDCRDYEQGQTIPWERYNYSCNLL